MARGYFYEDQAEQFTFYRIPKLLYTSPAFKGLSTDAKVLYGHLLDRVSLSRENKWVDKDGRVFIIFTLNSIQKCMVCSDKTATKYLRELERYDLIERVKKGQGRPDIIYVKNFADPNGLRLQTRKCSDSGGEEITSLDSENLRPNNTDNNKTEINDTDLILSEDGCDGGDINWDYVLSDRLEIDFLKGRYPPDSEMIDGMLDLIADVMRTKKKCIRVSGEDLPAEVVKGRFMKLTSDHLQYVLQYIKKNETKVRNVRQYLLATLYNAPISMDLYYQAAVNHDLANGVI